MSFLQELVTRLSFQADTHGLESIHEKLEGVHKAVEVIAGIEIGKAIFELAERFSSLGESLEASAIAAGISTDNLQKLQYAASQNAVGSDELSGALSRMARVLAAAQRGSKQAVDTFARIGITPEQLAGFSDTEQAFYAVQDAINNTGGTAIQKIGMLQSIFGRGSAKLLKFIQVGSDGTMKLGEEAVAIGAIVSGSGVKNLAELEDKVTGAGQVFKAFLASVGASVAPAFIQMIESIEKSWSQNQAAIQSGIVTFARAATFSFGVVYEAVRIVASSVARFASEHPLLTQWGIKAYIALALASAAIEATILAFQKAKATIALWKTVSAFSIDFVSASLARFQLATLYALEGLIRFIALFSPTLAASLRAFGTQLALLAVNPFFLQMALYAAGLTAIVLAIEALYTMVFKGGSFKDTWLGKVFSGAVSLGKGVFGAILGSAKSMLGLGDAATAAAAMPMDGAQSMLSAVNTMGISSAPGGNLASGSALAAPSIAMPGAATGGVQQSISAPINITVPPGLTQQQAIEIANHGAKKGMMDAIRDANRGFANAQAY